MRKTIYTEKIRCSQCRTVVGEYSKSNKERKVKSWTSVCLRCFRKLLK